jgi:SAM-dependent methyltransferase
MTGTSGGQDAYAIAGGEEGKRRLNLLAEIMRPTTLELLATVGVGLGNACLDVGCGGGHVTIDLAQIVGTSGRVVGIDFDPDIVELARQDALASGVENIEFQVTDACSVQSGPFDVVYARFLLSHVEHPDNLITHLSGLVSTGGTVVFEDIDFSGCYCYPRHDAYDRYLELYVEAVRAGGGDANIGGRLPALLTEAGMSDVCWKIFQPVHMQGPHKQVMAETMEKIGPTVLRHGLATAEEIDVVVDDMRTFAADPRTLVAMPRMGQAWGRV